MKLTEENSIPVLTKPGHRIRILAYDNTIFRITMTKNDVFLDRDYDILTSVASIETQVKENEETVIFENEGLTAVADKKTNDINFFHRGKRIFSFAGKAMLYPTDVRTCINKGKSSPEVAVFDRVAYRAAIPLLFEKDEAIFGLGYHEEGYANLRGKRRCLYQENMKEVIPVLVSTLGYGLLFNCGCAMVYDDALEHSFTFDCVDELDFFLIAGKSHADIMKGYYRLTGTPALLPQYAFGYNQSKERYVDAEELVSVVKEYRRRHIPLDVIVQDWQTWEEGLWGQKTFDRSRFPDPKAMTDEIHRMNARVMISVWPKFGGGGENQKEMEENGFLLRDPDNYYDALNPAARKCYWDQAKRGLFDMGIDCWWCDDTEPFETDRKEWNPYPNNPESVRMAWLIEYMEKFLPRDKIQLYSLYHAKGIYEGSRSCSDKRVLNLTRSVYAGQHRYGTVTWGGDDATTWAELRRHIAEGMNFTCTGEPYWSFDIGAFFPLPSGGAIANGDYPGGCENLGFREIYTRWLEYGAFAPVMRSHGTSTPREIWRFGEKGGMFYDAIEKFIRFRYRILPYLYSLAAAIPDGQSLMLHPALRFPEDRRTAEITDEFLVGDLLVCPVTEPMYYDKNSKPLENGKKTRLVYLPKGVWYDLVTGERIEGGQNIQANAPLDILPVYVKAGSIFVEGPDMEYTGQFGNPDLNLTIYPGEDADFVLYTDDRETYAYERGEYEKLRLHWDERRSEFTISAREGKGYTGMEKTRVFYVGKSGETKKKIIYDGNALSIPL